MLGEPYVTFAARVPAAWGKDFGLVYFNEKFEIWRHTDLSGEEAKDLSVTKRSALCQYLLFKKPKCTQDECKLENACLSWTNRLEKEGGLKINVMFEIGDLARYAQLEFIFS